MEEEKYEDLRAIGKLKATQISDWYKQRERDALYLSLGRQLPNEISNYNNTGKINRSRILRFLSPVIDDNQYEEIMVVVPEGKLIFSVNENYTIDSVTFNSMEKVIETQELVVNDLYYCPTHNRIHHDVMAPVFESDAIIAILILRSDPSDFLYPYIQEWPIKSKTGETILVSRRNDSAVFLNEMLKIPNTALRLKLPMSDTMVPAVKALMGGRGAFWGKDYRGDKVLSNLSDIKGTPWHLVVKIDNSELYDELYDKTALIGIITLLVILFISGVFIFSYYKKQTIDQRLQKEAVHQQFADELKSQVAQRTRELERTNRDLLSFAHVASHDLREPVRKIKTFLSMIHKEHNENLEDTAKRYLNRIEVAADRLEHIIEGVFQYSGIENGKIDIGLVDLNEIIKSILFDLELQIISKKAEFEICRLPVIEGSKIMLYQLFFNLINNSLKFSKQGEIIKINICSQNLLKNDIEHVEITIQDNGIGFEPEYSQSIFETFNRLHSKDDYEGSGLGLALCKRIVQKHNGTIHATGNLGIGAEFNLILPVKQLIS